MILFDETFTSLVSGESTPLSYLTSALIFGGQDSRGLCRGVSISSARESVLLPALAVSERTGRGGYSSLIFP